MITDEIFTDEILQQVAAELAVAINDSLPTSKECHGRFSNKFKRSMQCRIDNLDPECYTVAIRDAVISK